MLLLFSLVVDRQKEALLSDAGGGTITQMRSGALYDILSEIPKLKLTKENTVKLETLETDIPMSTFLYRLQKFSPKSSPVITEFLQNLQSAKLPEHCVANKTFCKKQQPTSHRVPSPKTTELRHAPAASRRKEKDVIWVRRQAKTEII